MNKTKPFKRTAFAKSAKSMLSLMLLLIAMLMPQGAWAISGSGTSSSPYLIANEADLRTFQQYVEDGNSGIYGKLTADITLTSAWTRIGRADRRFTGYFDGQGHTISGMNLSFTAYEHGFFGFVNNATIKNFTLKGTMTSSANGNHSHGTVVGSAAGTTVIENVTSSVNLTLNHTGFNCIGGIVGHMADNTRVTGCTYNGTINLNKDSEQVGGIVGYAQNDLYITNNVFSGTITSTGTCKYLAGIAGKTDGTIEVSGCTNIGTINGGPSYDCVAGIVGYVQYQSRALITNCYFGGSLSSTSSGTSLVMGGILGAVNDGAGTNFRGLTYCFSDGTLTATNSSSTQIGGIAGVIKSKAVSKVMNNTYLSGTASQLAAISNNSSTFDSSNKAITISVTAGTGGTVKKSYVYPTSTTATQLQVVATPNSGNHYVKWSDNGAQTHNVSLANNVSLEATFGTHTYGNWETDKDATCISSGTKHRVCTYTGCGAREDGTIAALGHGSAGYTESYSWTGDAYNDESQDTKKCTFTLTCEKCSTKVVNGASLTCTKTAHVDASCTATGSTTYQATGSYTAANSAYNYSATKTNVYTVAALGHGTTGYTESYSWTGNAYNNASQDTKACTFTLTCKNCSTKVVNGASLTCTKTAHVDATCRATGSTTYQATGSYTAANSAYNYHATKTNVYTVAALGHGTTGYTESYSWTGNAYNDASQDTKACTFTLTCKKCSTKVVNGASLTCIKTAHVDATCTATGSTTYQATGSYTAANSAYNYSATKHNAYTVAALGHSYGAGAWSWEDDGHSATCTRTCSHDANHTSSKSVTLGNGITSELTEAATCSKKGSHTYTATTTVENVEYSDSKEVADIDIDPLNHNYGAGVWSWNNDGHSATCTRTCSYDANHTSSASVTLGNGIESVKLSDPTCGVQGTTRYTAMTTVEGAQYSDTKDVDDIAATGLHTFDDVTDPNHTLCTVCDHSFFRYTATTKVEPNIPAQIKNAKGQGIYNSAKHTFADCNGVMEFDEPLVTIGELAFYNCTEFTGDLIIPNTVITIGINAFYGCGRNTDSSAGFTGNLVIPSSVTSIEEGAFRFCYNFKGKVVIPNSVTSIGEQAFFGFGKNNCSLEMQSIPYLGNYALRSFNTKTIVLSDDSYVYTGSNPYFPEVQSATYTRRGIKNQFGTLVLPFDVNGMGADYDLYKLDQVCENELVLRMVDVDDNGGIVPAGTPVVFRLHDGLAGNHTLTLTANNTTVSGQLEERSEDNDFQLVGTYETIELYDYDYFISNNMFWRVGDMSATVKAAPFRAYLKNTGAGAMASALNIAVEDDSAAAIDVLNMLNDADAEYYDLNGRRIPQLQKGINIVKYGNGKTKKVSIK